VHYQVEYPVLFFIPIILAFIPAVLTQSALVFIFSFQFLMVICDIVIAVCVYLIGLKIGNQKTAFQCGILYATAISAAYFVLTKSDAFATCIMMLALLFAVYGKSAWSYLSATLGFFTKVFPAILLPFLVFFHAKKTSLREELLPAIKIFAAACIVLLLPFVLISPDNLRTYLFATGGSAGVYANTVTYTLYAYLHDLAGLGISVDAVSALMYVLMGLCLLLLVYMAYADRKMSEKALLTFVLCAIFCAVFFSKFHSPQYILWYTPLLALLAGGDLFRIGLFYITQILAYIEFPLMFGKYYVNAAYVGAPGSLDFYLTLAFFTVQYILLLALIYSLVRPREGILNRLKSYYPSANTKQN
jgi:hypothetical protein